MAIKDTLTNQAKWTWGIMAASAQLGEMIREDAITSVNLSTIAPGWSRSSAPTGCGGWASRPI